MATAASSKPARDMSTQLVYLTLALTAPSLREAVDRARQPGPRRVLVP